MVKLIITENEGNQRLDRFLRKYLKRTPLSMIYKLIRKDFKGARKDYIYSITHYGFHEPVWKLRSLVGLVMSWFHGDVEWIAKLIGNASYK